jgi:hypothetical protein
MVYDGLDRSSQAVIDGDRCSFRIYELDVDTIPSDPPRDKTDRNNHIRGVTLTLAARRSKDMHCKQACVGATTGHHM